MQEIPLQKIPYQIVTVSLGGQECLISIRQNDNGLFVSVSVSGALVVSSIIARDFVPIVCIGYTGFIGNLVFNDSQGVSDPSYEGLGERFNLIYLSDEEYGLIRQ